MNTKLEFLKTVEPFNRLPEEVLAGITELLEEVRYDKDTILFNEEKSRVRGVDIIVSGEYESFFYDSTHTRRFNEIHSAGDSYGGISVLLNRKKSIKTVIAKKGTVVYFLHRKHFMSLCGSFESFFHYYTALFGQLMLNDEFAHFIKRPSAFEENYIASEQLYSRKIESIEYRSIVSCSTDVPIYRAAQIMANEKVSCLFLTGSNNKVVGYVTDMSLRDDVIAQQVNVQQPVGEVKRNPIVTIECSAFVYEAIFKMFRTKTRYLLVEDKGAIKGFISRSKLLSEQAQSPFVFIQSVKLASSVEELKTKWNVVPQIVTQLLTRGVNAEIVNQVITTISDTIAIKVIDGVIEELGKPPAKFVFMVLGSEGRKEQTLKTDQDNAIIYEDKANEHRELVRDYFLRFAEIVSDRLNYIGFSYCTGGFMAKNPKWTHSLSHWKRNYDEWMQESLPETVIKFSTFFDCRYLYGEVSIMDELKAYLDEELQKPNEKLFFYLAKNALQYEPPLTFFKRIRTITKGSEEVFDVKRAMTPLVDLVRVYALKNRIFEVNTGERLKALKDKEIFTESAFLELMQSYYLLMRLRLKKQATQIIMDKSEPDNFINIKSLTKIEQVTLKEIFKTIENFQSRIKIEFTNNVFG